MAKAIKTQIVKDENGNIIKKIRGYQTFSEKNGKTHYYKEGNCGYFEDILFRIPWENFLEMRGSWSLWLEKNRLFASEIERGEFKPTAEFLENWLK